MQLRKDFAAHILDVFKVW